MGSFDYTCCVSGLPIGGGDPVRFLLLTEHPYHKPAEHTCYMHDRWIPRIIPIKAKYNDYGTIEEYQKGPALDIVLDAFKLDLIERGVGDNSCHDVPVRKDMSFEKLLNALWEGRVLVTPNGGRLWTKADQEKSLKEDKPDDERLHAGFPTVRRVRKLLADGGITLSDGNFANGYLVDLLKYGLVRVRFGDFGDAREPLEKLLPLLEPHFATVITTGTGNYSGNAEMWIMPKALPHTERYNAVFGYRSERKRRCAVTQAMIREDVWQALCAVKLNPWREGTPDTVVGYRKAARELWAEKTRVRALTDPREASMAAIQFTDFCFQNVVGSWAKNEAVNGLGTALELMLDRNPTGPDLDAFLDTVGEFAFIHSVLSEVRYMWGPRSGGPQCGEWKTHKNVLGRFAKICQKVLDKRKADGWDD